MKKIIDVPKYKLISYAKDFSRDKKFKKIFLKKLDKLIFVSEWTKRQFFKDLPIKDSEKCLIIYPGSNFLKKNNKKKK